MSNPIAEVARLHGIADSYLDWRGQPREVSIESQIAILAALGIDVRDAQAALDAIHQHHTMRWTKFLPPVVVARAGAAPVIPVAMPVDLQSQSIEWSVRLENGEQREGRARFDQLAVIEEGTAEERAYRRIGLQ